MATFRQLQSGRWQARVFKDGSYKSIGTFPTKKEAEIAAAEAEKRKFYGQTIVDRELIFGDVIEDWFNDKKRNVKESTLVQLEVIKRLHIEPYFKNRKLFNITRSDIVDWLDVYEKKKDKNGEGYSFGAREKYLNTLKDIFNYAVYEMEVLDKNPAHRLRIGSKGIVKIKDDIKYYSMNELNI